MFVHLLRRLALGVVVLAAMSFLSFWVVAAHIDPLWPLKLGGASKARIAKAAASYHLDQPIPLRWWHMVEGSISGSGSYRAVWSPIWPAMLHTAELAAGSLVVVVICSLAIGTVGARRPGRPADVFLRGLGYLTWSIPVFLLALFLQYGFGRLHDAYGWQPFPSGLPGPEAGTGFHYALDWLRHFTLPVVTVALTFIGSYSRYVRSAMLVSLSTPYVVVARAKGLSERRVLVRHALRNSLIPFATVLTLDFGNLLGATLVADVLFGVRGIGALYVQAITGQDPAFVQAILTATAAVVVVFSVFSDHVYAWLDPRVRVG